MLELSEQDNNLSVLTAGAMFTVHFFTEFTWRSACPTLKSASETYLIRKTQ